MQNNEEILLKASNRALSSLLLELQDECIELRRQNMLLRNFVKEINVAIVKLETELVKL